MTSLRIADVDSYYDRKIFKDLLLFALITGNKYSIIPELYTIFGKDNFLKFVDLFGGATIEVPSHEDLLRTVRNVQMFLDVRNQKNGKPSASEIASKYGVTKVTVLRAYHSMVQKLDEEGLYMGENFIAPKGDINDD